jgi:DNA-binding PucR family transcriptional regulator
VKAVRPGVVDELRAAADDEGIALLLVRPQARWDQLASLIREVVDGTALAAGLGADAAGDLFVLAQTVAVLTAGSVSIEDAGNRVLAYSRSDDEIDELRRLSILGWEGPEPYMALLREWGVYRRLRTGEEVVHVEERPELGIRRRLAVGIRAGAQHLGTIWVQEGRQPFAEGAERALLGAARIAAVRLLRRRGSPGVRPPEELVADLLEGEASADLVAGRLGLDPVTPVIVVAFAAAVTERDRTAYELARLEVRDVVSVHATYHRSGALVGMVGTRVYAVLPDVRPDRVDPVVTALATQVVGVLRNRAGVRAQAGIGSPVPALGQVIESRREADRVLDVLARDTGRDVAAFGDLRAEVLLGETLAVLEANPRLRDPAVAALVAHDAERGTTLASSLLAYLDAFGDVAAAAAELHVHPNTLRYRLRRACAISGIDLDDPRRRLFTHLQLLLATRLP